MIRFEEVSESDAQTTYPVKNIIWSGKTAACNSVVFAESDAYGRMLFLDGELQSASTDERIYHESLVHPVLVATADTPLKRVLVIGGGEGATVREVIRWGHASVAEVVWVDIDTELVELCRDHLGWAPHVYDNPRVRFIGKDIREVLPDPSIGKFDVIILDLPDPDGDTGYLYSPEFWIAIKKALVRDGRIVSHVGPVRPMGRIGEGLQRVWSGVRESDLDSTPLVAGFYSIVIPSFQGSWGFWMTGYPMTRMDSVIIPSSLSVVDREQLTQWAYPPLMWRRALSAQVVDALAFGVCRTYETPIPTCNCSVTYSDGE